MLGDPICDDEARKKYHGTLDALVKINNGEVVPFDYKVGKYPGYVDGNVVGTCRCGWKIRNGDWCAEVDNGNGDSYLLCGPCGQKKVQELAQASGEQGYYTVYPSHCKGMSNIDRTDTGSNVLWWTREPYKPVGPFYDMTDCEIRDNLRVTDGPSVTLVSSTCYHDSIIDDFLTERGIDYETDAEGDPDALAEFAGRMCYWSFQENLRRKSGEGQNVAYLDHIREVGHGSVTEHAYFTFVIDDLSKNTTQELVRHRVGVAYSIQSSRYVDQFSNEYFGNSGHSFGIYIPPEVSGCRDLVSEWLNQWVGAIRTYKRTFDNLKARGFAKKDARSAARHILPGGMCNAVVFTVNCRELNHIFNLRGNFAAEREIRMMALALHDQVKHLNVFRHWERRTDPEKGDYLHNTDKDKPLFATIEEGLKYLTRTFDGWQVNANRMECQTPDYEDTTEVLCVTEEAQLTDKEKGNLKKLFNTQGLHREQVSPNKIRTTSDPNYVPKFEQTYCEDTNQEMVKPERDMDFTMERPDAEKRESSTDFL